jgi:hypothetical protein
MNEIQPISTFQFFIFSLLGGLGLTGCYLDLDPDQYPYPGDPVVIVGEPNVPMGCAEGCFRQNVCEGGVAISYRGLGACDEVTRTCDFSGVETRTDCSVSGGICADGACRSEPCENVMCPARAPSCEGATRFFDTGDGVCESSTGACSYSDVESSAMCMDGCTDGVCLGSPAWSSGDLLITEVMFDPATATEAQGEWFEIANTSGRTVNLNGLIVTDGEGLFQVDNDVMIAPDGLVVFANNGDSSLNGGLVVDFVYGELQRDFLLANATGDQIEIKDAGTVIVALNFADPGFPLAQGEGRSMQLSLEAVASNDASAGRWCSSARPFGDGGLGTPGQPNDSCD